MSSRTWTDKRGRRLGKGVLGPWEQQLRMDELSLGFCEKLYVVNSFVTELAAGHIVRIGREQMGGQMENVRQCLTAETKSRC